MNIRISRPLSTFASAVFLGLVLTTSTGCGALAAIGNPKVMWAIQDPAPMTVVVRRADVADATVQEVNRLLTATPTSATSDWLKNVGPDPKEAAQELKLAGADPMYVESHARVVAAEVWVRTLPMLKSSRGEHPNLLATINPDLATSYSDILGKKVEIAGIGALIDQEKAAADAKDIDPDEKAHHLATAAKLEKMKSDSENDVAPLEKAFLATAGDAAKAVPDDQKAKLAPAIANLLQALADADIANSAAAVRYPMALPSMVGSVKAAVPRIVADIIQEKTGKRPDMTKLKPSVTLHGTDVDVSFAGMSPADMGNLKIDELTKETITRTTAWFLHATGILATVSATKEALSFQTNVLTQILASLAPGSSAQALAVQIPTLDAGGRPSGGSAGGGGGLGLSGVGGLGSLGGATASAKLPDAKVGTGTLAHGVPAVPGVKGHGLPGGTATVSESVPSVGGVGSVGKGAHGLSSVPNTPAVGGKLPSVPNGAAGLGNKLPGAPSGLGSALGAAGAVSNAARDPKGAAADLAKEGAAAAAKKLPIPGPLKGTAGSLASGFMK